MVRKKTGLPLSKSRLPLRSVVQRLRKLRCLCYLLTSTTQAKPPGNKCRPLQPKSCPQPPHSCSRSRTMRMKPTGDNLGVPLFTMPQAMVRRNGRHPEHRLRLFQRQLGFPHRATALADGGQDELAPSCSTAKAELPSEDARQHVQGDVGSVLAYFTFGKPVCILRQHV